MFVDNVIQEELDWQTTWRRSINLAGQQAILDSGWLSKD